MSFQNRLFAQQLLSVAVRIDKLQIQRLRFVLIRLQVGDEVDDVLQQTRHGSAFILRNGSLIESGRHGDEHLARVIGVEM